MSKLQVIKTSEYELSGGGSVSYYDVGDWYMELITTRSLKQEIEFAEAAINAHKAWRKWLKKEQRKRKKNPRH